MRRRLVPYTLLLAILCSSVAAATGPQEARDAARRFGAALTGGDPSALRPILPQKGKVRLRLQNLGPEQGYFSAGQVEALLAEFLSEGSVRAFEVLGVERESTIALVHGSAVLTDRAGRTARVKLHLAFQPENDRWVLREIRELQP